MSEANEIYDRLNFWTNAKYCLPHLNRQLMVEWIDAPEAPFPNINQWPGKLEIRDNKLVFILTANGLGFIPDHPVRWRYTNREETAEIEKEHAFNIEALARMEENKRLRGGI